MFNSAGDHEEILILQDLSLPLQLKGIKKKKIRGSLHVSHKMHYSRSHPTGNGDVHRGQVPTLAVN